MTDKQTIIDGIDVSKCKYFDSYCKECKAEYYTRYGYEIVNFNSCKDNPSCYFKQLKRECQLSQEAMDNYVKLDNKRVKEYNELVDLYKTKEQECERLNEYSVGFARKCQKLELDVCHLKDKNYNLQRRLDQLKQTLTKIKEIAEEQMHYLDITEAKTMIEIEYDYAGAIYNLEQRMSKILQKISEVV